MYRVEVWDRLTMVTTREFPFGEWQEIGLWLDQQGFNLPWYRLVVTFREVGPTS